ncbi:hypothetical protein LINPERHAP2_LOCUS8578 [Linum perenne]
MASMLRLGLPRSDRVDESEKSQASSTSPTTTVLRISVNSNNKRSSPEAPPSDECKSQSNSSASDVDDGDGDGVPPPAKFLLGIWVNEIRFFQRGIATGNITGEGGRWKQYRSANERLTDVREIAATGTMKPFGGRRRKLKTGATIFIY